MSLQQSYYSAEYVQRLVAGVALFLRWCEDTGRELCTAQAVPVPAHADVLAAEFVQYLYDGAFAYTSAVHCLLGLQHIYPSPRHKLPQSWLCAKSWKQKLAVALA